MNPEKNDFHKSQISLFSDKESERRIAGPVFQQSSKVHFRQQPSSQFQSHSVMENDDKKPESNFMQIESNLKPKQDIEFEIPKNSQIEPDNQIQSNHQEEFKNLFKNRSTRLGSKFSEFRSMATRKIQNSFNFLKVIGTKKHQNKFIQNLLYRSYIYKPTKQQLSTIDDLDKGVELISNFQNPKIDSECSKILQSWKEKLWNNPIDPQSHQLLIWHFFVIFVILITYIWMPLKISFQLTTIESVISIDNTYDFIEIAILTVFILDIIIQMNTSYSYKGNLVQSKKDVIRHYLTQYLYSDLICFITSLAFFRNYFTTVFANVIIMIFFFLFRNKKLFLDSQGIDTHILSLINLIVKVIIICHIFACIWHGVAVFNMSQVNWLTYYQLSNEIDYTRYLYSFYWAAMTMITVGYGDITPKNDIELITANITMFLACGVFAFSINSIGIMLQAIYQSEIDYKNKLHLINRYLQKCSISSDLQHKIKSYLNYIWKEEYQINQEEVSYFISKLSRNLQEELQLELKGNLLRNNPLFRNNFSEITLKQLTHCMEETRFTPEEPIFSENIQDDQSIYFITKGEVDIYYSNKLQFFDRKYYTLKEYQSFGEISFFTGQKRQASAQSAGFCKVFKIKRENFISILNESAVDYEVFCKIKDEMILYSMYESAKLSCFSCKSTSHLIRNCPVLHLVIDKERVLKQSHFPNQNEREINFKRYIEQKRNSILLSLPKHEEMCRNLQQSLRQNESCLISDDEKEASFTNLDGESYLSNNLEKDNVTIMRQNQDQKTMATREPEPSFIDALERMNREKDDNKRTIISISDASRTSNQKVSIISKISHRNSLLPEDNNIEYLRRGSRESTDANNAKKLTFQPTSHQQLTQIQNATIIPGSIQKRKQTIHQEQDQNIYEKTAVTKKEDMNEEFKQEDFIQIFNKFEKCEQFTKYFPLNNISFILKKIEQHQKQPVKFEFSNYTFQYIAMMKAYKIRQRMLKNQSEEQLKNTPKLLGSKRSSNKNRLQKSNKKGNRLSESPQLIKVNNQIQQNH